MVYLLGSVEKVENAMGECDGAHSQQQMDEVLYRAFARSRPSPHHREAVEEDRQVDTKRRMCVLKVQHQKKTYVGRFECTCQGYLHIWSLAPVEMSEEVVTSWTGQKMHIYKVL